MKPRLWAGGENPLEYARPGPGSQWRASNGRIFRLRQGLLQPDRWPPGEGDQLDKEPHWTSRSGQEGYKLRPVKQGSPGKRIPLPKHLQWGWEGLF